MRRQFIYTCFFLPIETPVRASGRERVPVDRSFIVPDPSAPILLESPQDPEASPYLRQRSARLKKFREEGTGTAYRGPTPLKVTIPLV